MVVIGIGQVVPAVLLGSGHQLAFDRIVLHINQIRANLLLLELRSSAIGAFQDWTFPMEPFIVLPREEGVRLALEAFQVLFPVRQDGIVDMIRHLTHREHPDMVLPGRYTIVGEIDQMVTVSVEQDTAIGGPLVAMGPCILVKFPTLHTSRILAGPDGSLREFRKDLRELQADNTGNREMVCLRMKNATTWISADYRYLPILN